MLDNCGWTLDNRLSECHRSLNPSNSVMRIIVPPGDNGTCWLDQPPTSPEDNMSQNIRRRHSLILSIQASPHLLIMVVLVPLSSFDVDMTFGGWKMGRRSCVGWVTGKEAPIPWYMKPVHQYASPQRLCAPKFATHWCISASTQSYPSSWPPGLDQSMMVKRYRIWSQRKYADEGSANKGWKQL